MRIREKFPQELLEQIETLSGKYGEAFVPVQENTQELLSLSPDELKERFPKRYNLYVQALRRDRHKNQATDISEAEKKKIKRDLIILNGLDHYIEDHHDPESETGSLREHQITVFEDIRTHLEQGETSGWVTLPTGFGKTVIFTQLIEAMDVPTVIVVPTTQLVEQTLERIRQFTSQDNVGRVDKKGKEFDKRVVVTTYNSFVTQVENGQFNSSNVGVLILDEAHESLSDLRSEAVEQFTQDSVVLGFTATPEYSQQRGVENLLKQEIHNVSITEAIRMGALCGFTPIIAKTDIDLSNVTINASGEYSEEELERAINEQRRNQSAVELYTQAFAGETAFINCAGVQHAKDVVREFEKQGIRAAAVWGNNPENESILEQARNGDIQIVCGARLLIRGVDVPKASVCINLTPSRSKVDVIQRGGRVLRLDPDNPQKHAKVVDFLDVDTRGSALLFSPAIEGGYDAVMQQPAYTTSVPSDRKKGKQSLTDIDIEGLQVFVDLEEQRRIVQDMERFVPRAMEPKEEIVFTKENASSYISVDAKTGNVSLTNIGKELSANQIRILCRLLDIPVPPRASLARLKNGLTWHPGYHEGNNDTVRRILPFGFVRLSPREKLMKTADLARTMGLRWETANKAKKRGWFEVSSTSNLSAEAKGRIEGEGERLPGDLL